MFNFKLFNVMTIARNINKISRKIGYLLSLLIFPMIFVIVYLVVMRYFFKDPPDWGFEVSIFIYGLHLLLPGGYCLLEKAHVSVDIFSVRSSPRIQKMIGLVSSLVILFVSIVLVVVSSKWAWLSTLMGQRSIHQTAFNPPIWWFKWAVPLSASLIALQSISDFLSLFFNFQKNEEVISNLSGDIE